jgi:hypothetical protein
MQNIKREKGEKRKSREGGLYINEKKHKNIRDM